MMVQRSAAKCRPSDPAGAKELKDATAHDRRVTDCGAALDTCQGLRLLDQPYDALEQRVRQQAYWLVVKATAQKMLTS
jgi:hypothetical protein